MIDRITEQPFCQTRVSGSTFVNADCFDVFPFIEDKSIDAIIADLPYGTTKLIGRTRRHESLTYCQVELLFDAENEFDLETNEKIFNSETQNKGTQRSPFGMWS